MPLLTEVNLYIGTNNSGAPKIRKGWGYFNTESEWAIQSAFIITGSSI